MGRDGTGHNLARKLTLGLYFVSLETTKPGMWVFFVRISRNGKEREAWRFDSMPDLAESEDSTQERVFAIVLVC
jgi:hypothetical protein